MTPEERGYVAGIIDGEGCITILIQNPGKDGRLSPSHRLFVKVTMGHKPTIEYLHKMVGLGSIHLQSGQRSRQGKQWNDAWTWWVGGRQASALVREVRPLLITKAEEADVALEFDALPRGLVGGAGGNKRLSPEIIAARQDCFERIRDLKPSSRFRRVV